MEPVHQRIHNSPPPVRIINQTNPFHAPNPTSWRSILILSASTPRLSKWSLSLRFPHQNPLLSPIRVTCPTKLFLLGNVSINNLNFTRQQRNTDYTRSLGHPPLLELRELNLRQGKLATYIRGACRKYEPVEFIKRLKNVLKIHLLQHGGVYVKLLLHSRHVRKRHLSYRQKCFSEPPSKRSQRSLAASPAQCLWLLVPPQTVAGQKNVRFIEFLYSLLLSNRPRTRTDVHLVHGHAR